MKRRAYLAASGTGALAALTGCLGVLGSGSSSVKHVGNLDADFAANADLPADDDPSDGYSPQYGDPETRSVDESRFGALDVNGESVTLVPVDVSHYWHQQGAARFVDARGLSQYKNSHIYGAVNSPATRNSQGGGISGWSEDDRVVCYCGCPHHLSSIRAAGLQKAGFTDVYALDEGFLGRPDSWSDQEYPMAGTRFAGGNQARVQQWTISGAVDSRYAGEYVWATAGRQYEAAPVRSDGSYELHLKFANVSADTPVRIRTPTDSVERPLGRVGSRV